MKVIRTAVVAAAALMAVSSMAQARECGARPAKPAIPDGKTASDEAMKEAQGKVTNYIKGMNAYLQCVSGEIASAKEEATTVSEDWKKQSDVFVHTPKAQ
ncbi:MAG TPA: hypothetical protein VKZ79_23945 [Alphaproteobacteria bacterium]|nr:hypothetical protein [Alphaproteobacteria bacterium]